MKNFITKRAFTLVEILVVLVIMGFLVAMVAPRLAGMVSVAQEPIDTASQKELSKVIQNFIIQRERLPRGLVNLVHENNNSGTVVYESLKVHVVGDEEAELSSRFADRLIPTIHYLNADEALALKRLGVNRVRNYRHTFSDGSVEYNSEKDVVEGLAVLMVGGGSTDSIAKITFGNSRTGFISDDGSGTISYSKSSNVALATTTPNTYAHMKRARHIGRIIMGIDNESELVSRGLLESSGTSPKESIGDEIKFLNYAILLPRLDESVQRMNTTILDIRKYDKKIKSGYGSKSVDMNATIQALGDVVVVSPQGAVYSDLDFEFGVNIK